MTELTNEQAIAKLRLQGDLHEELRDEIPDRKMRSFMVDDVLASPSAKDVILRDMTPDMAAILAELRVSDMGQRVRSLMEYHNAAATETEQSDKDRRLAEIEAATDMAQKQRLSKRMLDDIRSGKF